MDEITSKRQLRRLVVLPYDLKIQEAFPENIKFGKLNLLIKFLFNIIQNISFHLS